MKNPEAKIYRLCVVCVALFGLTFVIPRFFPNPEGAFASGANAILVMLGMLVVTLAVSIVLLAITIKSFENISLPCRAAGIGPAITLLLILVTFFGLLGY